MIYIGEPEEGGTSIAKIYRPIGTARNFFGAQDYYLTVAPNVDVSFCAALCICIDEMKLD